MLKDFFEFDLSFFIQFLIDEPVTFFFDLDDLLIRILISIPVIIIVPDTRKNFAWKRIAYPLSIFIIQFIESTPDPFSDAMTEVHVFIQIHRLRRKIILFLGFLQQNIKIILDDDLSSFFVSFIDHHFSISDLIDPVI